MSNLKHKYLITSIICTLLCLYSTAYALAPIDELKNHLLSISSMQANFTQKVFSENQKLLNTYSGAMAFKKPNAFRWEVITPDETLIVTNGVKLWNYDADLEQVTVQRYVANKELTPISFILDDANNLGNNFIVENVKESCFKLTPKQETANFADIEVCFENKMINTVNIFDHLGQKSVFSFSQIQNNKNIADKMFSFSPPPGVDVIGE